MGWNQVQRARLMMEKQILAKYFPSFSWINPTDNNNTKLEGILKTNAGNNYGIRIYVPADFPNSRPDMVVIYPSPLKGYLGKDLLEYGASGTMHTLSPRDGYLQICHYKGWEPELTIYKVILKGRIWLEAFEGHKKSGKDIDEYLPHMI